MSEGITLYTQRRDKQYVPGSVALNVETGEVRTLLSFKATGAEISQIEPVESHKRPGTGVGLQN